MLIRKNRGRYTTYDEEEFEDTKGLIRIRKSKKNRQHNGQRKMTNGQTTIYKTLHIKTKDRVTRTSLKTGGELMCPGRVAVPAPLVTRLGLKHTFYCTQCEYIYYYTTDEVGIYNRNESF